MSDTVQPSGDIEGNKKTVLRFMELMDTHNFDALGEVLAPDFYLHLGEATLNRDETESMIRAVYEAFPDFTHTVEEILAVGNRVVMRATDRATHRGPFQGIDPTGRQAVVGQIAIYRIAEGRIAEIWEQFDMHGLMQQLQAPDSPDRPEETAS